MEIENTLTYAGLSRSESKIYCALAGIGKANVTRLAKETGMYRSNVYDTATKLISKGFISRVEVDQTIYFEAEDPSLILDWTTQRVEDLKSVMPSLRLAKDLNERSNIASIIEGSNNLFIELKEMLREEEEIFMIGEPADLSPAFNYILPGLINEIKKLRINTQIIKLPITRDAVGKALIVIGSKKIVIGLQGHPVKIIRLADVGLCQALLSTLNLIKEEKYRE